MNWAASYDEPLHSWCEVHSSSGRGPSPDGEACHYAALRKLSFPHHEIAKCQFSAALVFRAGPSLVDRSGLGGWSI